MHSIEDIIANAQSAAAASLRSAYEIGREHQTIEMRDKFVAFFEGVIGPFSKSSAPAHEPAAEAVAETPVDGATEAAPAEAASEAPPEAVAAEPAPEAPAEGAPAEG